jgi:hypothetical protein
MSGLYDKCILAKDANQCATLLEKCMINPDAECIQTFNSLSSEYQKGLRLEDRSKVDYIKSVLEKRGFVFNSNNSVDIVNNWKNTLGSGDQVESIRKNIKLMSIFTYLVEFVVNPEFTGNPATIKSGTDIDSVWFSPRPDGKNRLFSVDDLKIRPKTRSNNLPELPAMVGGGSYNMNKDLSYVNKIRYIDSLNTYYNMVGGNVDTNSKCCNELTQMYKDITNNLESHGKQVEASDNRIVETMLKKFDELEHKVEQIQANINKLSSMPGANISAVLKNEQEKLKVESKYLSSQGKSLTSIIRSLFESSEQLGGDNGRVLANARAQFPPHSVSY